MSFTWYFFASGRTNAVIASNVSGFFPILSLLLYSICRKKAQKAKNNERTFFWTNKYLKRTIVRYGLSPLARTLISFMSSWIFFTLPTRSSRQKRANSKPKILRKYRVTNAFPSRSSLSAFFIMPLPSCFLLIVACTDQRKHGEKAHEKQGLYASQGLGLSYFQF